MWMFGLWGVVNEVINFVVGIGLLVLFSVFILM